MGFRVGDIELGLDPRGGGEPTGAIVYWEVPDIAAAVADLVAVGSTPGQPVTDVGGGKLIATVEAGGVVVGLIQEA